MPNFVYVIEEHVSSSSNIQSEVRNCKIMLYARFIQLINKIITILLLI